MAKQQPTKSEGNIQLLRYFTQFPNILDEQGKNLNPFEFRLLMHYYRVGDCWEGVRKTAEKCGISQSKVSTVRTSLEAKGFITIDSRGPDGVMIRIVDKTKENLEFFDTKDQRSQSEQGVRIVEGGVPITNAPRSQYEHKNNHSKNNQLRITEDWGKLILDFFNSTRKQYGYNGNLIVNDSRLKAVARLMKDGFKDQDIKNVIAHRFEKWSADDRMKDYLTPETIFRPSNFPKYLEEFTALPAKDWTQNKSNPNGSGIKHWPG